jgi:hypothetical protein
VLGLSIALTVSLLGTVVGTIATIIILARKPPQALSPILFCSLTPLLLATVEYNPIFQICFLSKTTPIVVAVWVAPVGRLWMLVFILFSFKQPLAVL